MYSLKNTVLSATAIVAMVQYCPAPFLAVIPEAIAVGLETASDVIDVAGDVAGTVSRVAKVAKDANDIANDVSNNDNNKRLASLLGLRQEQNQLAWQECHDQLTTSSLTFSSPANGTVLAAGVPSACMTLVTVITGQYDEGNPVPMGSDSVQFSGLSDSDIDDIESALTAKGAGSSS